MNKRLAEKIKKRAEDKIIQGQPLTQMERITQNKYMEKWLGPEIVGQIRHFGRMTNK
jgi:hypothetical protein